MYRLVKVAKLEALASPYSIESGGVDPWGASVTLEDVTKAIRDGRLNDKGFQELFMPDDFDHAARIAYFHLTGWSDSISLGIGIPVLRYYPSEIVSDGNHRLAAAIYGKHKTIKVDFSGELGYFNHLFVKPSSQYSEL